MKRLAPRNVSSLAEHRHQRVVGRLGREVLALAEGDVAAAELEARGAQQQRVQLADRGVALRAAQGDEQRVVGGGCHDGKHERLASARVDVLRNELPAGVANPA